MGWALGISGLALLAVVVYLLWQLLQAQQIGAGATVFLADLTHNLFSIGRNGDEDEDDEEEECDCEGFCTCGHGTPFPDDEGLVPDPAMWAQFEEIVSKIKLGRTIMRLAEKMKDNDAQD